MPAFLVGQTKRTFILYFTSRDYNSSQFSPCRTVESNKKKVRNDPRQRLSALRSPSGRGNPDKRAGVGDGEMREKRERCRKMQAGIIYC